MLKGWRRNRQHEATEVDGMQSGQVPVADQPEPGKHRGRYVIVLVIFLLAVGVIWYKFGYEREPEAEPEVFEQIPEEELEWTQLYYFEL